MNGGFGGIYEKHRQLLKSDIRPIPCKARHKNMTGKAFYLRSFYWLSPVFGCSHVEPAKDGQTDSENQDRKATKSASRSTWSMCGDDPASGRWFRQGP